MKPTFAARQPPAEFYVFPYFAKIVPSETGWAEGRVTSRKALLKHLASPNFSALKL